jgi:hypothetical protein
MLLRRGLPIGSGEIESGNRSVLHARLKLGGAWWKAENAGKTACSGSLPSKRYSTHFRAQK